MALDPTPDASLLSLAADLDTRSAALRATAAHDARLLSQHNGNGTVLGTVTQAPTPGTHLPRLQVLRRCVPEGTSVWDTVTWETRDAKIVDKDGTTVFEQRNVRVPSTWSQTAVNVVASKYFRLVNGIRETGVDQMMQRVSATITEWGIRDGYFDAATAAVFAAELQYLLLHQMTAFNSPVWFNIGVPGSKNQASACFIIDVEDSMESILEWYRQEGLIFQGGSGAGVNVSKVRGNGEPLSSGGTSSGILSFMKAADRSSGAIKSGGSVRRAAKMVQMDIDHPDIKAFITCKQHEETKARILIAAGYDPGLDGEAYETVAFQNANHSVVVPDAFLRAVEADGPWHLTRRVDGAVTETVSARALFRLIAETAHSCGDPGIFFSDTANQWHTTPTQGPIRGTNPCVPGETLVLTREGYRPIVDIAGVVVDIWNGYEWSTVTPFSTGVNPTVTVTLSDETSLRCTPNHDFVLHSGEKVQASNLAVGQKLAKFTMPVVEAGIDWDIDAYSQGFYSGDGTQGYDVSFVYYTKYACIPRLIGKKGGNSPEKKHWYHGPMLDKKNVPINGTKEYCLNWLAGLLDSDGTLTSDKNGQGFQIASIDKEFLLRVRLMLTRLGVQAKLSLMHASSMRMMPDGKGGEKKYLCQDCWRLLIGNTDAYHLMSLGLTLNRLQHQGKPPQRDARRFTTIASIEDNEPCETFCFTEEKNHTGTFNGIVTGQCSEFLRPPDEACNLSCLNLLKFLRDDGSYDIDLFTHAVDIMITAKEILVGHSNYPTEAITKNSHAYRTLGQGYANLGGLLMAKGLPYDSDAGRNYAASITALMTGEAYAQSARLASVTGPFSGFLPDKDAMMMIIQQHRDRVNHRETNWRDTDADLWDAASRVWLQAERLGYTHGYRNAQVSLLMPAGTVGLMMGCGTTGVEPDVALVNYKALVGGGTIKKVNEIVPQALQRLGYNETTIHQAQEYIEAHGTLEGFQWIQEKHLPVFDCAFPTTSGGRSIHWRGHMLMVAALQPFLSMGISKTINMPHDATVEDVEAAYLEAWNRGCKSIAIYRDGSKYTQVVTTRDVGSATTHAVTTHTPAPVPAAVPFRRRLPDERAALTHKFQVGDQEGYLTIGLYDDGTPGEIFIHMSKEGSTISGLIDAFATSISMALQYGVPLQALCDKFQHSRFAPSGFTHHPQIRIATSVTDYIFRYLALKFLDPVPAPVTVADPVPGAGAVAETGSAAVGDYGAGVCPQCGGLLRITGNCSVCSSCGMSMGCS